MKANRRLSYAIATALWGSTVVAAEHTPATPGVEGIEEITVTAQRRVENLQDVPIAVQALTAESLKQLNVTTFDDFVKYLPNVSIASTGPGQSTIFMRGLSVGVSAPQGQGTAGAFPNVAVYLDDEPVVMPGRNLDVYAADLERIEVLEGPQGTLFGSGAQAGVLRYITNSPKLDKTEFNANAAYSYTSGGDPNTSIDATLNLPLIDDRLAVRLLVYNDSRGGYINNQASTFTRLPSDLSFKSLGLVVPTDSAPLNNYNMPTHAINPLTYKGLRASALVRINDEWDILIKQSYQNMEADGVFYQEPYGSEGTTYDDLGRPVGSQPLPPRTVTTFNPAYDKDKFENTSLVVNGRIGDLKVIYSGSYFVRNVEQQSDYTDYSRGLYASYYQCYGVSTTNPAQGRCYSPSEVWQERERNSHQSHEIRVSTPDDWRVRGQGGIYWEEFKLNDETDFLDVTLPACSPTTNVNCFNPLKPPAGFTANNPNVRNGNDGFFDDTTRTIQQKAAFTSLDIGIIPDTLIATVGTRYYRFNEEQLGGNVVGFSCFQYTPTTYYGPCLTPLGTTLDKQVPNSSEYHGFRSRAGLSWHINGDLLLYYTWSQGFRPGGFNRGSHKVLKVDGVYQYATPLTYAPDTLTNNEIGFKTEFFERRLQINGAIYQEDWKSAIVEFLDPQQGFGILKFGTNGANYRVRGGELQLTSRPLSGLTVTAAGSYNDAKEANSPFLLNNNPASPNFGKPITSIPNVFGPQGSPMGLAPKFQGNIRIRQDFPLGAYMGYVQAGAQYYGSSFSSATEVDKYLMPGYSTFNASVGVSKDAWYVQLFADNLGDKNASQYTSAKQYVLTETVLRPRIAGIKIGYTY